MKSLQVLDFYNEEEEVCVKFDYIEETRAEQCFSGTLIDDQEEDGPVEEHPIEIIEEVIHETSSSLCKMRLIDMYSFLNQINDFPHANSCSRQKFSIEKEVLDGFSSNLYLKCDGCNVTHLVKTNREDANKLVTVSGMNAGLGWTGLGKLFRPLGCPTMTEPKYGMLCKTVGMRFIKLAVASCREAAE